MFEEEGPKDWELKEEEPPKALREKWEREEAAGSKIVLCPSCKKETPFGNLTCVFCASVILPEVCPISCFLNWVKCLFDKGCQR